MSFGPERRIANVAVALSLGLAVAACGSAAESTGSEAETGIDVRRSSPSPGTNAGAPSCTPAITLTAPAGAPMPPFECPAGWITRDRETALPMSGRFTSATEIVDAFCERTDAPADASPVVDIDFAQSDVVAIAYDGEIGLFGRGAELWVRHVERACDAPPSYRTVLFLVPKGEELHEQYCSLSCE